MKRIRRLWINSRIKFTRQAVKRMLFWGLILFFISVFLKIGSTFQSDAVLHFDELVLKSIFAIRREGLNGAAMDITALGSITIMTLFTLTGVVVLILSNDKFGALQLALASIGNSFLSPFMKLYFERERPSIIPHLVEVRNFSYPSGHSLAAASMYLTLALLGCKHLKIWNAQVLLLGIAGFIILLIGTSRVYLGVHYPTDVVGGICLGAAWALLLGWCLSLLERTKEPKSR